MKPLILPVLAVVLCGAAVSNAQSLADVARAEEARRKSVKQPGKVYTNDTLKPDFTTPPPVSTTPQSGASKATEKGQEASATQPASEQKTQPAGAPPGASKTPQDEAAWRKRITTARADLQRSQIFAEALRSRINALNTDFINRDDPAQRAVIDQDRQKALVELERVKADIAQQTKAIADIEEEARKAGVPAGWLR
jgi:hypothetical protein